MSTGGRSDEAAVAVLTRMSRAQKRQLERDADAAGMTMRLYVLWRLFGVTEVKQTPGRIPRRNQEALPMTG